jgi:hypothetical protein
MYIVRTYKCTSRIKKFFTQMVQNYSGLYLAVPPPTVHQRIAGCPSAPPDGWTGDSDL